VVAAVIPLEENMFRYSIVLRTFITAALVISTSVMALADTVRLKDGSIIKGKIVRYNGGRFVVVMGEGSRRREMTFAAGEVESVTFDESTAAPDTTRNAAYKPQDVIISTSSRPTADDRTQPRSTEKAKPISWQIKVLADDTANGWTNTGWVVKKGQRIHISGDGKISIGNGKSTGPAGLSSVDDPQRLLKNVATGALIAVIGDDNNDFIYIGADREIVATRDGALFLGINEGNLNDNSGAFNVKVEILPDGE
jgi:hypothetical protein